MGLVDLVGFGDDFGIGSGKAMGGKERGEAVVFFRILHEAPEEAGELIAKAGSAVGILEACFAHAVYGELTPAFVREHGCKDALRGGTLDGSGFGRILKGLGEGPACKQLVAGKDALEVGVSGDVLECRGEDSRTL